MTARVYVSSTPHDRQLIDYARETMDMYLAESDHDELVEFLMRALGWPRYQVREALGLDTPHEFA